jgi:erythromycin esterase-like protein
MSHAAPTHATLADWIAREAISFSLDSPQTFNTAVDRMIASLGDSVELLGLGEALHGGEEILILRNRLFARLVERHGYSAIAVESSMTRAHVVNDYVTGRAAGSYDDVRESGFSHGFGRLETNRELIEWMRAYNERAGADAAGRSRIQFYGFDSPTEMTGTDSPRRLLHLALDYLAAADGDGGARERARRVDELLGADADWENPAAMMDPTKSIGLSPAASALRIETEDLITELRLRRPALVARSGAARYLEAEQHASAARLLLNYHAGLARASSSRLVELLGIRDLIMADNLAYAVERERGRGKVLAFAHNSHLKRGQARWQLGPHALAWWPAGAQLSEMLGARYAVIGSGVGVSEDNGIGRPEAGTLEARLTAAPGPARFIATHGGEGIATSARADLPTRSASTKNSTYFALTPESFSDFDGLVVLDSVTYNRGGPPLPERTG